MKKIEFDKKFDKLKNNSWSTVRRYNEENIKKYSNIGDIFEVFVEKKSNGLAVLKDKKILSGNEIDFHSLANDTIVNGKIDWDWYFKIKNMKKCFLLTFEILIPAEVKGEIE